MSEICSAAVSASLMLYPTTPAVSLPLLRHLSNRPSVPTESVADLTTTTARAVRMETAAVSTDTVAQDTTSALSRTVSPTTDPAAQLASLPTELPHRVARLLQPRLCHQVQTDTVVPRIPIIAQVLSSETAAASTATVATEQSTALPTIATPAMATAERRGSTLQLWCIPPLLLSLPLASAATFSKV
jgi:hypothetical protein